MSGSTGKAKSGTFKSPFSKGGDVQLKYDTQTLLIRGVDVEIEYHYYECVDTGKEFTTLEVDQLNLNLARRQLIPYLAEQGFLIEIISDGWANWDFDKDGRPIRSTASPNRNGYVWRGCYEYFNLEGDLMRDDVGTGLYHECIDKCVKAYQSLKDDIDSDAFGSIYKR